jgi:hypothetical protein
MTVQDKQARFSLDGNNRLIVKRAGKIALVPGNFSVDSRNDLIFHINRPVSRWKREFGLGKRLVFTGSWKVNGNHDLELKVARTEPLGEAGSLVLRGRLIDTGDDALVFEVDSYDQDGLLHARIIKITGEWSLGDKRNLTFMVKRTLNPERIILEGGLGLDNRRQLVYTYEKVFLKRRNKSSQKVKFVGYWQVNERNRLTYILERGKQSAFDFRVQAESPNLYPQEGRIKYRLGTGFSSRGHSGIKTISLYGAWKFSKKGGVSFVMDYGAGRIVEQEFQCDLRLSRQDELGLVLKNKSGRPLGIALVVTRKLLKKYGAEIFLRMEKEQKGLSLKTGVRLPF